MTTNVLFDIPRSPAELASANMGLSNAQYRQITATRAIQGDNFTNGVIQFAFETDGVSYWAPKLSYFRMRVTYSEVRANAGPALPPLTKGDIAPVENLMASLFKSIEIRMGGVVIERIGERLPQLDALKIRMTKPQPFMQTLGRTANILDYDWQSRQQIIAVDGYEVDRKTWDPKYAPNPLTQVQAGFDVLNQLNYAAATELFTWTANGGAAVDILNGAMALREGDVMVSAVAADPDLRIVKILSATTGLAEPFGNNVAGNISYAGAVAAITIQKLHTASRNDTTGKNTIEIIWQPPMGFFSLSHAILPGAKTLFELNPSNISQFKADAIQSFAASRVAVKPLQANNLVGDFDFSVDRFEFYMYQLDGPRADDEDYYLDIMNTRVQIENMPTSAVSLQQKNFDVNGRTTALTLAFQDQEEGSNTLFSRSQFKIRTAAPAAIGGEGSPGGQDLLLRRMYITYGNKQKPQPDFDGQFVTVQGDSLVNQTNFLVQRYIDTALQQGSYGLEGATETYEEWLKRGPYYHFQWPQDATAQHTRVNVSYQFARTFEPADSAHKMLLFSHWRTSFHLFNRDGKLDEVVQEGGA